MTTSESAPDPAAGDQGITVPAHHLVGMDLGFTCVNCGGHTSTTQPCIPAKTYPGFTHATPDADDASECEDGVFGSQDIANALGGRGPDEASETLNEATDWWCMEANEPRQIPCCTACVPSLSSLLREFYDSDDGDYVSALGDIHKHVAAREAAAATKARAEGAAQVRDDIRARRREFRRLKADQQYLNALDDAFGLAANRAREGGR